MRCYPFQKEHAQEAAALARANYLEERQYVNALPEECDLPDLRKYAGNGLGVAAFDGKRMIGFLCCTEPFDNAFRATNARGVFSPMGANAAVAENRSKIYAAMYQAAAKEWVRSGAVSHGICLYAHDQALQRQFYRYGFGLRCVDAIRLLEPVDCEPCGDFDFFELVKSDFPLIYPLHLSLNRYCCESPFFMNRTPETQEAFLASSVHEGARYFAAERDGILCAYVRITALGETFAAAGSSYRHITGAYCLPEHRGKGVYQNLLNLCIFTLKKEGYTRLGVDFESFNPAGSSFWHKYFCAYTHGVVRRIDERIIRQG